MKKIGVIGIGNPFRSDDEIGIFLLQKLNEKKENFPNTVTFVDGGTGGMNLLHLLSRFNIVFIIDAVDFSGKIGELRVFTPDEVMTLKKTMNYSTHEPDMLQVIQLSHELDDNPPEKITIIGIQPKNTSLGSTISDELKEKIPIYLDEIIKTINDS